MTTHELYEEILDIISNCDEELLGAVYGMLTGIGYEYDYETDTWTAL